MTKENSKGQRLVVVSNRLPFSVSVENGSLKFGESSGGLVTGMAAALQARTGGGEAQNDYVWVGWPGSTVPDSLKEELKSKAQSDFNSYPVFLAEDEMDQFYHGFCNKTIWPLFHYFPSYTAYREDFWEQYKHVNEIFCEALMNILRPGDVLWIHDYHLMLLPQMIKARLPNIQVGFFLHIPFPSFEVFRLLPGKWRREILEGFLGADLIGFHTYEYTQHFLQCVLRIIGHEHNMGQIISPDRLVKVDTFPMGIDFDKFSSAVKDPSIAQEREELKKNFKDVKVILSVDRLDYTKGIVNRLVGYELLLQSNPEYHGKVVFVMVVVPSRIGVEHYNQMKKQMEELVGRINGKFGRLDWTPLVYQYHNTPFHTLVALYSLSDVALITPLRDGMNLVAKEYIASRRDYTGMLILSEMAGAAKELGEAIIINPNYIEEIAAALKEALEIPVEEQKRRNQIMSERLRRYNVIRWAKDFVQELISTEQVQQKFVAKLLSSKTRQKLVEDYSNAGRRLLLLDYDGTLTPFVSSPSLAKPTPELLRLLRTLAGDKKNSVVLISGRDRHPLEQWLGELPIVLVAEHGTWIKEAKGDWKLLKQQSNEWKTAILSILQLYADRLPGAWVEQKEFSLVWHYRRADPEQAQTLSGELMDHLVTFTANVDIQIMRGNKIIEVRAAGLNKGTAALHFLAKDSFDFILAAGDDWTDEDMFGALPESANTLKVGIVSTHARYNVRNTREVHTLMDLLAKISAGEHMKLGAPVP